MKRLTPNDASLIEAVDEAVETFISQRATFSAYDITKALRALYTTVDIEHVRVRNLVHRKMDDRSGSARYSYRDNGTYIDYTPIPEATSILLSIGDPVAQSAHIVSSGVTLTGDVWHRVTVHSSWVNAVSYEFKAKKMQVELHRGKTYEFDDVEPQTFFLIVGSESVGKAIGKLIASRKATGQTGHKEV